MKSLRVHLLNKYVGCRVHGTGNSLSVYNSQGRLLVEAKSTCHGTFECNKKDSGARDELCLSPIPKNSRFMKLYNDGRVDKSEEHDERIEIASKIFAKHGKVLSIIELKAIKQLENLTEIEKA